MEQVESLFHHARGLSPDGSRHRWLEEHCGGDPGLLEEVVSLLEAHAEMKDAAACTADAPLPSALFGSYRAVELIGRGGMSAVYRAQRVDGNFDQTVALKVMAAHLAGPEFLSRFQTERRLLASLGHNHITRLLDGGVSTAGDPYLITEYIDGELIDDFCDSRKLDVKARIRIFLQVCDAVDYAHRNLIVHRDLKPGNILVNSQGEAKLLDFGTASLLARQSDVTVTRLRMLTPRYASPEELRGERVNTSTDIFSLGVILYEQLTGAWPFGERSSMLSDLNRVAKDVIARPPSTAVTAACAEQRSVAPAELSRILKGDLSAVVLKTLEQEPGRRYGSARELAADLDRYLDGRPVQARPQTALYRGGKFLRRHWLPVTAAAVFVVGLLAATLIAWRQAQISRARYIDLRSLTTTLLFDLKNAITDVPGATEAQRILVTRVLKSLDQMVRQSGEDPPLRLNLAEAYRQLGELQGDPYGQNLGDTAGALASLEKAQSLAGSELKLNPSAADALRTTLLIEQTVGEVYFGMGKGREAGAHLAAATDLGEKLVQRSAAAADVVTVGVAYQVHGDIYGQPGTSSLSDPARAAESYRRAIQLDQIALQEDPKLWRAQRGIGLLYTKLGDLNRFADPEGSLAEYRRGLDAYERLPADEWNRPGNVRFRARMMRQIGGALRDLRQWGEAEEKLNEALQMHEAASAADPHDVRAKFDLFTMLESLLELYDDLKNPARARPFAERIIQLLDDLLKQEPANRLWRLNRDYHRYRLATELSRLGDASRAAQIGAEGLAGLRTEADSAEATPIVLRLAAEAFARIEPTSLRDPARAVRYAQHLMRLKPPGDAEALYYIAIAEESTGNKADAIESARLALAALAPVRDGRVPVTRAELESIR
ncbi:MAG: serine/threonine protein kinase [Acidobacteriia bacterium]|nr:serine/threonine protein kinase [Terriglobia bacterium]